MGSGVLSPAVFDDVDLPRLDSSFKGLLLTHFTANAEAG